jgi:RNA ligase (TIGR02306 family)
LCKLTGEKQRGFPKFISRSDEIRIQNLGDSFCQKEKDTAFTACSKIDGQSLTAALMKNPNRLARLFGNPYIFILCSRNLKLGKYDPNNNYWKMAKKYDLENKLKLLIGNNDWVAVQGESVGVGIQENKYKLTDNRLYIFNLIYPSGRVDDKTFRPKLEEMGLPCVPLYSYDFHLGNTVAESVEKVTGLTGGFVEGIMDEGVVVRDYSRDISFKIINPLFLLKHNL